jgi:hypothetical protein
VDLVLQESLKPNAAFQSVSLASLQPGTYIVALDDAKSGFKLGFTGAVTFGILADENHQAWTIGRNNLVFRVDNSVREFTIYNGESMTLKSPAGRTIPIQKGKGGVKVQVRDNETGIWEINRMSGTIRISGVLPFLSPDPRFLLTAS